ncbi:MAG: hypothetical protein GY850_18505 [bacterium]|nr:hypothetical protein [bacterium]
MKRLIVFAYVLVIGFGATAYAGDITVVNNKAGFPEGPLWHNNELYYAEYGTHKVSTWNGQENRQFWKLDGCGPSAVVALSSGNFYFLKGLIS